MDVFFTPPDTDCKMFYLITLLPYAAGAQLRPSDEETLEKMSINQIHLRSRRLCILIPPMFHGMTKENISYSYLMQVRVQKML
jgi:hypothetical protein